MPSVTAFSVLAAPDEWADLDLDGIDQYGRLSTAAVLADLDVDLLTTEEPTDDDLADLVSDFGGEPALAPVIALPERAAGRRAA